MNAHSLPKRWDYASGVFECERCAGSGLIDKTPLNRIYRDPPGYWDEPCPECEEQGVNACAVCGFDEVVKGYDCIVCEFVADLSPSNMKRISPADLAEHFAQAFAAALGDGQ